MLSDQNMKTGCHAIFFLQRLNLILKGYIILDRTHDFHGISGNLSSRKLDKKASILCCECMETIVSILERI